MEEQTNTCKECGKNLFGRIDKKFCNDGCRNAFYNRTHRETNTTIRHVNKILKKNRNILAELNTEETTKTNKNKLLKKGFNFDYFTNVYQTKKGTTYYYCYDQGYLSTDGHYYTLVVKKEYV